MFIWSSIAHLIALTSPGPDTAVTIRQVTLHGRNAGIYSAIGIGVGIYAHCLLAINGISLLVLSNELYKLIISIVGGSYLFYLGVSMMMSSNILKEQNDEKTSNYGSFFLGLITNIFNVKAFIFFVSLFTILLDSIDGIYFYIYPIYFSITSALWFILLSYLLTSSNKYNIHDNKLINRLLSILLCFIGLFVFTRSLYEYF